MASDDEERMVGQCQGHEIEIDQDCGLGFARGMSFMVQSGGIFGYTQEVECCAYDGRGNIHVLGDTKGTFLATAVEAVDWVARHASAFRCPLKVRSRTVA